MSPTEVLNGYILMDDIHIVSHSQKWENQSEIFKKICTCKYKADIKENYKAQSICSLKK